MYVSRAEYPEGGVSGKIKFGQEERIKMTRLRQTIAKRLKQAQENAALLTTFNEVDMTNIMDMRKENQEDFQNRYSVKLGFMSFFVLRFGLCYLHKTPQLDTCAADLLN